MFSTIIFDFDGTLVDSNNIKLSAFTSVLATSDQISLMLKVIDEVNGDRFSVFRSFVDKAHKEQVPLNMNYEDLVDLYSSNVDHQVSHCKSIDGAEELLKKLQASKKRVILSSATPIENLQKIIKSRKWDQYFDAIYGSPHLKENTLSQVINQGSLDPSSLIVVGDGLDDKYSAEINECMFYPVGLGTINKRNNNLRTLMEYLGI